MQLGTAWLRKSLLAFSVSETNYKRALKLSLAAAVFSAFLCLPLALAGLIALTVGPLFAGKEQRRPGDPRVRGEPGTAARWETDVRGRARAGLCRSTSVAWGQSLPVPQRPRVRLCPPLISAGEAFGNNLDTASFGGWGSKTSGLPSPSHGEGAGGDVGDASCSGCLPGPNPSRAGPGPPAPLQSCLSPGRSNAGASKGSRCLVL